MVRLKFRQHRDGSEDISMMESLYLKAFRMHRQDDFKNRKKKKTGMECWMQQVMDMSAH